MKILTYIQTRGAGVALILNRRTSPGVIVIPLLLIGVGVGCIFQPTLVALQAHSPKSRRAVIISNRNFFRSAGGACGLAVSAAVLQARLRATLPTEYSYLSDSTYSLPDSARDNTGVLDAYMAASHAVFILQVPLIGLCFLGTAFIRDRGLEPPEDKAVRDSAITNDGDAERGVELDQTVESSAREEGKGDRVSPPEPRENATEEKRVSV